VFAAGDVRAGSVKRGASAVGEGAISIHMVHMALAQLGGLVVSDSVRQDINPARLRKDRTFTEARPS
jgi:hypothetical protein